MAKLPKINQIHDIKQTHMRNYTFKHLNAGLKNGTTLFLMLSIWLFYFCRSQTLNSMKPVNPYFKNSMPKNHFSIREDFLSGKSADELNYIAEMNAIVANPDAFRSQNIIAKSNEEQELENEAVFAINNPILYESIKKEMYSEEEAVYREFSLFLISNPMIAHKYVSTNPSTKDEAAKWAEGFRSIQGIK